MKKKKKKLMNFNQKLILLFKIIWMKIQLILLLIEKIYLLEKKSDITDRLIEINK